jgi:hypothetical protein
MFHEEWKKGVTFLAHNLKISNAAGRPPEGRPGLSHQPRIEVGHGGRLLGRVEGVARAAKLFHDGAHAAEAAAAAAR